MTTVDSKADVVRALFYKRRTEHYAVHGGMLRPPPLKPVLITRGQFDALRKEWDPLKDGPVSNLYPDNETYQWRDVPFIVIEEETHEA